MSDSILYTGPRNNTLTSENNANFIAAIITVVINIVSGIFAVTLNSLLLHTLILKQKSASRILICNLAVADLLTGLVTQSCYVVHIIMDVRGKFSHTALFIFNFSAYALCGISLVTAGGMSLDRLLATLVPFRYKHHSKPRLFVIIVMVIWLQALGIVSLYMAGIISNMLSQMAFSMTVIFAVLSFVISYSIIVKNHRVRDRRISHAASLHTANQRQQRQSKVNKTFACMVVAMCLMYLPMVAVKLLLWKADSAQFTVLNIANRIANTTTFLNSSINPVLYCYGNVTVRAQIKESVRNIVSLVKLRADVDTVPNQDISSTS